MNQPTPADLLRAAATKLREAAASICEEIKTNTYWHGVPVEDAWARGSANALGGPAGDYAAMFGPDIADAIANWLDHEARQETYTLAEFGYRSASAPALATARAILGEVAS